MSSIPSVQPSPTSKRIMAATQTAARFITPKPRSIRMSRHSDESFRRDLYRAYIDGSISMEEMNRAVSMYIEQENRMQLLGKAFLDLFRNESHGFGVNRSRKIFIYMPDLTGNKASLLCENTRRLENSFMFNFTDNSQHIVSVSLPGIDRPHLKRIPSWLVLP